MKAWLGLAGIAGAITAVVAVSLAGAEPEPAVRVAFLPSVAHAIPIVGMQSGAFAESFGGAERIDARVFDSGTQAVQSLVTGNLDIAYVGPGPAVNAFVRTDGNSIVIVSGAASGGVSLVAQADSGISKGSDLEGKRIAVPQIANTQDVSLRTYLVEHGIVTSERGGTTDVLAVAGPEMYTLFARNTLDAAWAPEPWATLLVESLGATRVLDEKDLWPDSRFSTTVLVARADYAESNPDELAAWLDAHQKTAEYIDQNPKGAIDAYAEFAKDHAIAFLEPHILEASFSNIEITTDILAPSILEFAERAYDLGYLGREKSPVEGIFYAEAG